MPQGYPRNVKSLLPDDLVLGMMRSDLTVTPSRIARLQGTLGSALVHAGRLSERFGNRLARRGTSAIGSLFPDGLVGLRPTPSGTPFSFPLGDGYYANLLHPDGALEPELAALVLNIITQEPMLVIDGGSNRGFFVSLTASMGPHIIAIEAAEDLINWVQVNSKISTSGATIVHAALWSKDNQEMEFRSHPRLHPGGGLAATEIARDRDKGWTRKPVKTVTIDSLIAAHRAKYQLAPPTILLKLDVEGAELNALQGAKKALESGNIVVAYEQHSRSPNRGSFELLKGLGYSQWLIDDGLKAIADFGRLESLPKEKPRGYNVVAARPGRLTELILAGNADLSS